jgi:hypothetical protein
MTPAVNPHAASVDLAGALWSPAAVATAGLLACLSAPLWAQSLDGETRGRPQPAASAQAAACTALGEPLRVLPAQWRAPICQAASALTVQPAFQPGPSTRVARSAAGPLR